MSDRKLVIVLPTVLVLGVSALVFGLVPGVRDWIDVMFPMLGINGPKVSSLEVASGSSMAFSQTEANQESERFSSKELDLPAPLSISNSTINNPALAASEPGPMPSPVTFAQATAPVPGQQNSFPSPRVAQNTQTAFPLPEGGLPVPSSAPRSGSSNGKFYVNDAQIKFPLDIVVAAQSDGVIMQLNVDEGSLVKEGDVFVVLDTRIAEAEVEVASQELKAALLKEEEDSSVKFAKAAADVAKADLEISDNLFQKDVESFSDNNKKRLELTKATLQISVAESEKKQQGAAVELQKAKLKASKVQTELRTIRAPWTGVVSDLKKKQYSFARAGDEIFRLTSMQNIRVEGFAEVDIAPHLLLGAPAKVSVRVPGQPNLPVIDSKVAFVAPRTSGQNKYKVYVNIINQLTPDGQQYLFREGMDAVIEISMTNR
jgi:biotin carboxyl carrier protein